MKAFYSDLHCKDGSKLVLLAGPFALESVANQWAVPAAKLAYKQDPALQFCVHGVSLVSDYDKPGQLNAALGVPANDLGVIKPN